MLKILFIIFLLVGVFCAFQAHNIRISKIIGFNVSEIKYYIWCAVTSCFFILCFCICMKELVDYQKNNKQNEKTIQHIDKCYPEHFEKRIIITKDGIEKTVYVPVWNKCVNQD